MLRIASHGLPSRSSWTLIYYCHQLFDALILEQLDIRGTQLLKNFPIILELSRSTYSITVVYRFNGLLVMIGFDVLFYLPQPSWDIFPCINMVMVCVKDTPSIDRSIEEHLPYYFPGKSTPAL